MDIAITPGHLQGSVKAPPSKSAAHRAAICAALSAGSSTLSPIQETQDMAATLQCAHALGARYEVKNNALTISGIDAPAKKALLDCGESGSTLRFFLPIAAALGTDATFIGSGKLPQRPILPLTSELQQHGIQVSAPADAIVSVSGQLDGGLFALPGDVSSQFITGLLFALPLLQADSKLQLTAPLQSAGYVDMTLESLARVGIRVYKEPNGYGIPGRQRYRAGDVRVEGDYSSAAFFLCAGALGGPVTVEGLAKHSLQGDRAIVDILKDMGAGVAVDKTTVTVLPGQLRGIDLDVSQIPDLVPVLAALAACADGVTQLYNAGRLRIKESDRLATVTAGLRALGAGIQEERDKLVITGKASLDGGEVDSYNDHRIAMAMSIAALRCTGQVIVRDAGCVDKSYPAFYRDFEALGGLCRVI